MSVLLLSGHKSTTFIHKNQEIIDFFTFSLPLWRDQKRLSGILSWKGYNPFLRENAWLWLCNRAIGAGLPPQKGLA